VLRILYLFKAYRTGRSRLQAIVSDNAGHQRIEKLLKNEAPACRITGRISIDRQDTDSRILGNISELGEILRSHRIREVVFASGELNTMQIIDYMHLIARQRINVKIASEGETFIVGSGYVSF
jgi:hypothetical protein